MSKSKIKTMLICFSTVKGVVHKEFLHPGQTLIISTIMWSLNDSEKEFIVSRQRLQTLGCLIPTMLPVTLPSPWTNFWPKMYFSGYAATNSPDLSPCVFYFSQSSNSNSKAVFWNCGQHPNGRDRAAEGTSTWRLPALLPGVGATSPAVCGFPRELLCRG